MGKHIKKLKGARGVAIAKLKHEQTSIGVRTRAKTLALQCAQTLSSSFLATSVALKNGRKGDSYLQLRSRKVERLPPFGAKRIGQKQRKNNGKGPANKTKETEKKLQKDKMLEENENEKGNNDFDKLEVVETSCGENVLEFESKGRSTRESSPCNLMRDPEIPPPLRCTKRSNTTSTGQNPMQFFHIPAIDIMHERFADDEERDRKEFIEKYNFDPLKDEPLPGRFEWEKLKP
ncbi:hypothetical protein ACH5RR_031764 [Cinchona calisaya]|uniref:Cyclin-dependent kinase inhibitor domain-containing protein n=1 Tax=Cinchona calisaya TaxID=153742 RepID=A0ABD2YG72_9GENT